MWHNEQLKMFNGFCRFNQPLINFWPKKEVIKPDGYFTGNKKESSDFLRWCFWKLSSEIASCLRLVGGLFEGAARLKNTLNKLRIQALVLKGFFFCIVSEFKDTELITLFHTELKQRDSLLMDLHNLVWVADSILAKRNLLFS